MSPLDAWRQDLLAPDHEAVAQRLIRRRRSFTTSRALVEAAKKRGVEMTFMGPAQAAALAQSASESNLPGTPHHHHHHGGFPGSAPSTPKKFPGTKRLRIIQTRPSSASMHGRDASKKKRVQAQAGASEVVGLQKIQVRKPKEIFRILDQSIKKRATHETAMNRHSSRSHAIFSIYIQSKPVRKRKKNFPPLRDT